MIAWQQNSRPTKNGYLWAGYDVLACLFFRVRVTSGPPFVLFILAICNTHKASIGKLMFSAKSFYATNRKFFPCWGGDNNSFHPVGICFQFGFKPLLSSTLFSNRLRFVFSAKPRLFTLLGSALFSASFRGNLPAFTGANLSLFSSTHLSTRFGRKFSSQTRACFWRYIKAIFTERFYGSKPVLFTVRQEFGKEYKLQHFKGKVVLATLIPCALQFFIPMTVAPKQSTMCYPAPSQIDSTSHIKTSCCQTTNFVDSWYVGDTIRGLIVWGIMILHVLNLLNRLVCVWLGLLATASTPPHYTSTIAFCLPPCHILHLNKYVIKALGGM